MDLLELGEFLERKRKQHRPLSDPMKCKCLEPNCEMLEMIVAVDVMWNIIGDLTSKLKPFQPDDRQRLPHSDRGSTMPNQ